MSAIPKATIYSKRWSALIDRKKQSGNDSQDIGECHKENVFNCGIERKNVLRKLADN